MSYTQRWVNGVPFSEHRSVYEEHFGLIPDGFHIHHRDGNPRNNSPDNLEALSPLDHTRSHHKTYKLNEAGEWLKECRECGVFKPVSEFHSHNKGTTTRRYCKPCRNKIEGARLARRKAEDPEFRERQRQCVRNWYRKLKSAAPAVA